MEPPPLPAALTGEAEDEEPDELEMSETRPDGSPDVSPMVFFPLLASKAAEDPEATGASRSAWLAVFFAAACALVTIVQYRAIFSLPAEAGGAAAEQPPVPEGVSASDSAPAVLPVVPPSASRSSAATSRPEAPACEYREARQER